MRIRIWGARGLIAAYHPQMVRYGTNTPCVEVISDDDTMFILDCGTGIQRLSENAFDRKPFVANLLITNSHWDHIQGLPFFDPIMDPSTSLTICSVRNIDKRLEDILAAQMDFTYSRVSLFDIPAKLRYRELLEEAFEIERNTITTHYLNYMEICIGYKITSEQNIIAYITDHEPYGLALYGADPPGDKIGRGLRDGVIHVGDQRLIEFLRGVDLIIQDCQYASVSSFR